MGKGGAAGGTSPRLVSVGARRPRSLAGPKAGRATDFSATCKKNFTTLSPHAEREYAPQSGPDLRVLLYRLVLGKPPRWRTNSPPGSRPWCCTSPRPPRPRYSASPLPRTALLLLACHLFGEDVAFDVRGDGGEDQALQFVRFQGLHLPLHGVSGVEAVAAGEGRPSRVIAPCPRSRAGRTAGLGRG